MSLVVWAHMYTQLCYLADLYKYRCNCVFFYKYQNFVMQFANDGMRLLIYIFLFSAVGRLQLTGVYKCDSLALSVISK
jgi:hypothetical protein